MTHYTVTAATPSSDRVCMPLTVLVNSSLRLFVCLILSRLFLSQPLFVKSLLCMFVVFVVSLLSFARGGISSVAEV